MAHTRPEQKRFPFKLYDHEGRELAKELIFSPNDHGFASLAEYNRLATLIANLDFAHKVYIAELSNALIPSPEQVFTSLKTLLFPNDGNPGNFEQSLEHLFACVTIIATKAVEAQQGGFFGYGTDIQAYDEISKKLKEVGEYIESKIIEMPWCAPISEKAYLLTALKESPEAFLAEQKDTEVKKYVSELNHAKRNFPKKTLEKDGSDLSKQVAEYTEQIREVESKYANIGSACFQRIQTIEAKRESRWAITNFFVDLFTNEKGELEQLKNRQQVANSIQAASNRLGKGVQPLKSRSTFNLFSSKMLKDASSLSDEDILALRDAIKELTQENDSVAQIKHFAHALKLNILTIINDKLALSPEYNVVLAKQFAFLAASEVVSGSKFDDVRIASIQAITEKLKKFEDADVALQFIKNVSDAKPECLDASKALMEKLSTAAADYTAWAVIQQNRDQLLDGSNDTLDNQAISKIRLSTIHASHSSFVRVKEAANNLDVILLHRVKSNIDALKQSGAVQSNLLAKIMGRHLAFYATPKLVTAFKDDTRKAIENSLDKDLEDKLIEEEKNFADSKAEIRKAILNSFNGMEPVAAIAYINKWEQLESAFNQFDSKLYQDIQNKKSQHKSIQLLQNGWDYLLNDNSGSQLSADEVDQFIAAVLWLDKPNDESRGKLIDLLRSFTSTNHLHVVAKEKIAQLKERVSSDFAELTKQSLTPEKMLALKSRLKFVTKANSMYTKELHGLRAHVILSIRQHLQSSLSTQDTKRYLDDLLAVMPDDLKLDADVSQLIHKVKKELVIHHFTKAQRELHQEYQKELEFLRTGNLSLWDAIKSTIHNDVRRALTPENIYYWRHTFLDKYADTLTRQRAMALDDAGYSYTEGNEDDEKVVVQYLDDLIFKDYKTITDPLVEELVQLSDLRRKHALAKLDKIFGLKPTKPVDMDMFMFRYFAVAEYQRNFRNNATLVEAGRGFVRQFHDIAQHSGGFTTEIIAKLSYEALDQMYCTWSQNPEVSFSRNSASLTQDIIGKVDASRDTNIQVPQYLLLNMVLELIVADFDALLRGDKVDLDLLNDRIEFAIPKLEQEMKQEEKMNLNSDKLRQGLKAGLAKLNIDDVKGEYIHLIVDQMPKDFAQLNTWGFYDNLSACENRLLTVLKSALQDQVDIISQLKKSDLNCSVEETAIERINAMVKTLKSQISPHNTNDQVIRDGIKSLVDQRIEYTQAMEVKKAKAKVLKEFEDYVSNAKVLLTDNNTSFKDFILQLNVKWFELLDPKLAATCSAIKQNITLSALLEDKQFKSTHKQLVNDLDNKSINILDIVRDIPESMTKEFSAKTADMVRQLQYRFADRFRNVMTNMLDHTHLNSIDKFKLFSSSSPQKTARERLQEMLKSIKLDTLKRMFNLISPIAEKRNMNLQSVCEAGGFNAPINIPQNKDAMKRHDDERAVCGLRNGLYG